MAGINLLDQLKNKKGSGLSAPTASPKMSFGGGGEGLTLLLRFLFLAILGYGGFLGLKMFQDQETEKVQVELTQIQNELAKEKRKQGLMAKVGEEMRGYLARMDELDGKLRAVSQQETDRSYLIRALEYAAIEMPKEMWLSEVSTARSGTGGTSDPTATFRGYAINAQAVSDFIQKLEASVYFPSTTLTQMELVGGNESNNTPGVIPIPPNARRFQIIAKLGE